MELREQIACYRPVNAQEEKDKEQLLAWLGSGFGPGLEDTPTDKGICAPLPGGKPWRKAALRN